MNIQGPNYTSGKLIFPVNVVRSASFCNKRKAKNEVDSGDEVAVLFQN